MEPRNDFMKYLPILILKARFANTIQYEYSRIFNLIVFNLLLATDFQKGPNINLAIQYLIVVSRRPCLEITRSFS